MEQPVDSKPCSVHLIDDDEISLMIMHDILRMDYRVSFSRDLSAALQFLIENVPPNVIVLDMLFEFGTGEEFIDFIRSSDKLRSIPVIFCSSIAPKDSYLTRNVYYLPKPIFPRQLLDLIEFII